MKFRYVRLSAQSQLHQQGNGRAEIWTQVYLAGNTELCLVTALENSISSLNSCLFLEGLHDTANQSYLTSFHISNIFLVISCALTFSLQLNCKLQRLCIILVLISMKV